MDVAVASRGQSLAGNAGTGAISGLINPEADAKDSRMTSEPVDGLQAAINFYKKDVDRTLLVKTSSFPTKSDSGRHKAR